MSEKNNSRLDFLIEQAKKNPELMTKDEIASLGYEFDTFRNNPKVITKRISSTDWERS